MGGSLCVLALAKNCKLVGGLARRGRTRTAQRSARQIFHGVNTTPRHINNWVLAVGNALNAGLPSLLKHVQAHHYKGYGCESQRKQRKGGYEFAHKVQLQRDYHR